MFVAVYFNEDLDVGRDEIEELLLDALADQGKDRAKVTGGGFGEDGGNIDLKVDDELGAEEVLRLLRHALQSSDDIPRDTDIQIEGSTFPLHPKPMPKGKSNGKRTGKSGRKKGPS